MEEHRKQAGARVRQLREARRWTNEELAHRAELSVKTVSRFQAGKNEGRRETIRKLAQALEVTEADIIGPPPKPFELRSVDEGDEILSTLRLLVERQEALELAVVALTEQLAGARRQASPGRRRAS